MLRSMPIPAPDATPLPLAAADAPSGGAWRGIACMVLSTACFAAMHGAIRHLSDAIHPFEIAFFRNLFGVLVVVPWLVRLGLEPLRTRRFGLHALRAAVNAVAMLSFFTALSLTPLTQVTALAFSAPIFATLLAVVVFGERVRARRWTAIAVGFAGTVVVLRPGIDVLAVGPWLALASSLVWAVVMLMIKVLGRTESSVTITAYMSLLMAPITLVPALFVWTWPTVSQLAWLVGIGVLGGTGQLLMAQALKEAETQVVMPFDFLKLVWASIIAYFAFAEVPDAFTWVGGMMIFCSAAYIAYRERQPPSAAHPSPSTAAATRTADPAA